MTYAAYDYLSICGLGPTPDEAIQDAREQSNDPGASFETANISDELAAQIDRDGWNGNQKSFAILGGYIVDTTEE